MKAGVFKFKADRASQNSAEKAKNLMENEDNIEGDSELAEILEKIKPQPRLFDGPAVFDRNAAIVGLVPANALKEIESGTFDQAMVDEFKQRLDLSVAMQRAFSEIGEQLTDYLRKQGLIDSNHTFSGVALIDPNRAQKLLNMPDEVRQMIIVASATEERADFPIHLAPDFIQRFSKVLADYANVPVSIPFLATVAMLSTALGRNLRIQSARDRFTPGNIYAAIFVTSGVCKSEVYGKVSKPLTERHRIDRETYFTEIEPDLQAELELIKIELEALGRKAKKEAGQGLTNDERRKFKDLMKEKAVLELKMKPPEYYAEDYTIEALGAIMARNGEQLAAISPEASKPIQNLKGLYSDGKVEDTIYNKSYSLEAGKVDRISREANEFHEPCLALLWLTQPDKIPAIFSESGLVEGGFTPRLISLHESVEIQRTSWDSKYLNPAIIKEYEELWNDLFDAYRLGGECVPENEADGLEDVPWQRKFAYRMVITDKEIGRVMFEHFNNLVERRNSDLQDIQQFPARWTENAWRLALIFHASKYGGRAHTVKLEAETCKSALEIMDWFARGQLQLLGRSRVEVIEERCRHLLEIVAKQPNKRMAFGKLKDNHGFEPAELRQLAAVSNGKLRIVEPAKGGKGGRPTCYVAAA